MTVTYIFLKTENIYQLSSLSKTKGSQLCPGNSAGSAESGPLLWALAAPSLSSHPFHALLETSGQDPSTEAPVAKLPPRWG